MKSRPLLYTGRNFMVVFLAMILRRWLIFYHYHIGLFQYKRMHRLMLNSPAQLVSDYPHRLMVPAPKKGER